MIVAALVLLGLAVALTVLGIMWGGVAWLLAVATAVALAAGCLALLRDRWL